MSARVREKSEPLPAIKTADEILNLITQVDPEDITEALKKLSVAESTWGLLWGLENLSLSGKDLEFYELKKRVVEFMAEIHADRRYPLAVVVMASVRSRRTLESIDRGRDP